MVPEPLALSAATATAQEAGELRSRARGARGARLRRRRLVGVVTRKTLVREVVARGRDPRATTLGEIAEPPNFTLDADDPLDEAFHASRSATSSACRSSRTASSSACSRARSCSGGSPRTSRRRDRAGDADRRVGRASGTRSARSSPHRRARIPLAARRRIGVQEALRQPHRADVEAVVPAHAVRPPATSSVEPPPMSTISVPARRSPGGDAAEGQLRLLVPDRSRVAKP
jgi:hypothetical protein